MNISSHEQHVVAHAFFVLCIALFSVPSTAGWQSTWVEPFNGSSVDWDNWTAQTQANYNNEVQCYTDNDQTENRNYEVSQGSLKIIARKDDINCPGQNGRAMGWTSGRLNSKDKQEFLYGRIEARIRFDTLLGGTWPAFWMLENRIDEQPIKGDNDSIGWPNPGAGEIDIWEWYANSPERYITNFFNANGCGDEYRFTYPEGELQVTEYNRYAMEWSSDSIAFFFNDKKVIEHDVSNCPQYKEPMFVLINVAIGGNLGGAIDPALQQATMEVDYVARCIASDSSNYPYCDEGAPIAIDNDNDGVPDGDDQCPDSTTTVTVNSSGCEIQTEPNLPAPSLDTIAASNVIGIFSDAVSPISGVDLNPNWGQATQVTFPVIDNDNLMLLSGLNYQGIAFETNPQDVTEFDHLVFDYWTANSNQLSVFLISPGPAENAVAINVSTQQWERVRIPLSDFTTPDLSQLFQMKFEGKGDIYLDNIVLTKTSAANTSPDNTDTDSTNTDSADTDNTDTNNTDTDTTSNDEVAAAPNGNDSGGGSSGIWLWISLLLAIGMRQHRRVYH